MSRLASNTSQTEVIKCWSQNLTQSLQTFKIKLLKSGALNEELIETF